MNTFEIALQADINLERIDGEAVKRFSFNCGNVVLKRIALNQDELRLGCVCFCL